ncbi:hypothetical protein [Crinalium epipsammum]|nr:hypothetical protein [Crinalium epipsammum]
MSTGNFSSILSRLLLGMASGSRYQVGEMERRCNPADVWSSYSN